MYESQPGLDRVHQPYTTPYEHAYQIEFGRVIAYWPETDSVDVALLQGGSLNHVPILHSSASRRYGEATPLSVTVGYATASATGQDDCYCVIGFLKGRAVTPVVLGFLPPKDSALFNRPTGSSIAKDPNGPTVLTYSDGAYELRAKGASLRIGSSTALQTLDSTLDPGTSTATRIELANSAGAKLTLAGPTPSVNAAVGSNTVALNASGSYLNGNKLSVTGGDAIISSGGTLALNAQTLSVSSGGILALSGNTLSVSGGNPIITGGGTLALGGQSLSVSSGGTLALGSQTLSVSGGNPSITGGGTLALGGRTLTVGVGNVTVNGSGTLSLNSQTLSVSSGGTLALNSQTLTVSGGNPNITGGGTLALGGQALSVSSGGTLALGGRTLTVGVGNVALNGSGTLSLSGHTLSAGNDGSIVECDQSAIIGGSFTSSGDTASNGFLNITINGTSYKLMTRA